MLTGAGGPAGDEPPRRDTALATKGPVSELLQQFSALPTFVDTGGFEAVLSPHLTIHDRRTRKGAPVGSSTLLVARMQELAAQGRGALSLELMAVRRRSARHGPRIELAKRRQLEHESDGHRAL